jgi:hypothetical protein
MPRRVAAAMVARLASGSCQRLSRSVPSMSSAIRRTLIRPLYLGRAEGLGGIAIGDTPSPVFSELFILKDFKSFILKVRILKELRAGFSELRIVKDLAMGDQRSVIGEGK